MATSSGSALAGHYFDGLYPHLGPTPRPCKTCGLSYYQGNHIEITTLEAYTSYVCPSGEAMGHSGIYTGAHLPEMRTLTEHLCTCGQPFVKEDSETWQLTWEMSVAGTPWRTRTVVRSKHAAHQQRDGLEQLVEQGESIRNVQLVKLEAVSH